MVLLAMVSEGAYDCRESRCESYGPSIHFPFRLRHQPEYCGYPGFELSCDSKNKTILTLPNSLILFVEEIDYMSQRIRLHDPERCLILKLLHLNLSSSPFVFTVDEPYVTLTDFSVFVFWSPSRLSGLCRYCEGLEMDCGFKNYTKQLTTQCFNRPVTTKGGLKEPLIAGGVLGIALFGIIVMALYEFYNSNKIERENRARVEKIEEDDDIIIVRKLAIIGLWCIQWNATDRPSIKVVTQMLEGDGNNLNVPPPFTAKNSSP
ncbi:hypothetical protein HAX54_048159 [Datura stramonium]|uniref:RING-type E3 ubiquitin transferase n=1 Tax=Datura stramonium TaxID=4076 RepID=A0ABS8STW9_DATST|nr:hypothetical protein [Datura stramonium]